MKRFLTYALSVLLFALIPLNVFAAGNIDENTTVIYFDDGSYLVETIQVREMRASGTKSGTKTKAFYGSDDELEWKAILQGKFTYTGSSSSCTSSSCNVTIYDSAWYTVSKSATKSGNTANASVTMGEKLICVTVRKVSTNLSLSCDANGNLS